MLDHPVEVLAHEADRPYIEGMTVVNTPGHTPGHTSLYANRSKMLIAGDAMVVPGGHLQRPNPNVTPDMPTAVKSIGKFNGLVIDTVICYHSGIVGDNIPQQLAQLTENAAP